MSREAHVRFCESARVRFPRATHLVVLVDGYPRWQPDLGVIKGRVEEELRKVAVGVNEEKTWVVDFGSGQALVFWDLISERAVIGSASDSYCARR